MIRTSYDNIISGGLVILSFVLCSQLSAQTTRTDISADELVRRTAIHEAAAATAPGYVQYRFEERTARGSEVRDVLESSNWSIDHLILKDGQPLAAVEQRREDERLRSLYANPRRFEKFQKEQLERNQHLRAIIAAFPKAFSCQYDSVGEGNCSAALVRVKFRPNSTFVARSWEERPLQGLEGTLLIDAKTDRLVQVNARFFRDVDFGGGVVGRIGRGGSVAVEQQVVGGDHRAITSLALHFNKRVLLVNTRVDSVAKASEFRCIPQDMTLQQGLQEFLQRSPTRIAAQDPAEAARLKY